jgi:hypothetical protein
MDLQPMVVKKQRTGFDPITLVLWKLKGAIKELTLILTHQFLAHSFI